MAKKVLKYRLKYLRVRRCRYCNTTLSVESHWHEFQSTSDDKWKKAKRYLRDKNVQEKKKRSGYVCGGVNIFLGTRPVK